MDEDERLLDLFDGGESDEQQGYEEGDGVEEFLHRLPLVRAEVDEDEHLLDLFDGCEEPCDQRDEQQ